MKKTRNATATIGGQRRHRGSFEFSDSPGFNPRFSSPSNPPVAGDARAVMGQRGNDPMDRVIGQTGPSRLRVQNMLFFPRMMLQADTR